MRYSFSQALLKAVLAVDRQIANVTINSTILKKTNKQTTKQRQNESFCYIKHSLRAIPLLPNPLIFLFSNILSKEINLSFYSKQILKTKYSILETYSMHMKFINYCSNTLKVFACTSNKVGIAYDKGCFEIKCTVISFTGPT